MTKKDYELIADSFGFAIGFESTFSVDSETRFQKMSAIETAIGSLSRRLKEDNPRFDSQKFRFAIDQKSKEIGATIESAKKVN